MQSTCLFDGRKECDSKNENEVEFNTRKILVVGMSSQSGFICLHPEVRGIYKKHGCCLNMMFFFPCKNIYISSAITNYLILLY